jgi:hypothetical protein
MTAAAPLAPAGALRVQTASRVIHAAEEFAFDVTLAADPTARLAECSLVFPGFEASAPAAILPTGGVRFRGRLHQPGFHAPGVSARVGTQRVTGREYFVVREAGPVAAAAEAGYYVFLGCGDYPIITGQETHPLADWTLAQWKELVTWMGANGMNRLWTLVNGYTLAYPSKGYTALRDRHARNAAENFLGGLIDHAHGCGVKVYLMLTTDGHARDFSVAHPEAARRDADGQPGPQFGLALEHPLTRRYIFDVLDEVLELYPHADGVAVHPTESDPDRFNPETLAAYRAETGRDLTAEARPVRQAWHNLAFARFLNEFAARCQRHNPALDLVMANCWWQDDFVVLNHATLSPAWRIAVWHYAWEDETAKPWPIYRWVESFGPSRVLYLPTSQSYLYPTDPAQVMTRHIGTDRLVSTAAALGVRDTMYFAGWDILPEAARLLDVALVRHPTALLAEPGTRKNLIPQLYADYFGTRAALIPM